MDLTTIFYHVDNFCKQYEAYLQKRELPLFGERSHGKAYQMTLSEVISVLVYHGTTSHEFKTFKAFYKYMQDELQSAFPGLVSYGRMIELREMVQVPLCMFLITLLGRCTGVSYGDSTKIEACNIKRASSHKTLKKISAFGQTGSGWFYGSKLHLVLNHVGEIISFLLTPGNFVDNNHEVIRNLTQSLHGKFFADRGYIIHPDLWQELYERGLQVIHGLRSNMANKLMPMIDKILLRKRACISEGGFSILKDRQSLQYTKHRSIYGFLCHIVSMLIAYQLRPNKPSIRFSFGASQADFDGDLIKENALVTAC